MKNKILIFLLFLTFNANAIGNAMLMAGMASSMEMSMSSEEKLATHNHLKNHSDEVSTHEELRQKTSGTCDNDINCSACLTHCMSAIVLIEAPDFGIQSRLSFSEIHVHSEAVSNIFRLLRPPRLS